MGASLLERIFAVPDLYLLDLTGDGRSALIASNETGAYQLHTVDTREGRRRRITPGEDRVLLGRFSQAGDQVAFPRDEAGREEYRIFAVDLGGEGERGIMTAGGYRIFDLAWSPDDRSIAFAASTREKNGLWIVGADGGGLELAYESRHPCFSPDWNRRGSRLALCGGTTEDPRALELILLDPAGGTAEVFTPAAGTRNTGPKWSPDGGAILFKTDAPGAYDLALLRPEGMEVEYLGASRLGFDFPDYGWLPDGSGLWFLAAARGRTEMNLQRDGGRTRLPLPRGSHGHVEIPEAGTPIAFSWSTLARPPSLALHDPESGATRVLYDPLAALDPGLADELAEPQEFEYGSFDARRIHGFLLRPRRDGGRPPCLLWPHGGPFWLVGDSWNPALQALATAGFTVLCPNFRGSTGYGAEFEKLIHGDPGGGDLLDMVEGRRWAIEAGIAEPDRIAMIGASYGGFVTNIALVKFPDLWRCGVSIVGVTDWREDYELADASFRSFDEELLGKPTPDNYLYFDRSPIHFVGRLRAPLLLWHRANDSRCPLAPVEKFAARARALGKEVELVVVEDEGHGPQKTRNLVRQYAAAVEFLRRHLGRAAPPP